jgi:hypothetical protein
MLEMLITHDIQDITELFSLADNCVRATEGRAWHASPTLEVGKGAKSKASAAAQGGGSKNKMKKKKKIGDSNQPLVGAPTTVVAAAAAGGGRGP